MKMHSYSVDNREREFATAIIALLSLFIAKLLDPLWSSFGLSTILPIAGLWGIFGLGMSLHNRYIWRMQIGSKRVSMIPDLNGNWKGTGVSSHKIEGCEKSFPVELMISQTWQKISITGSFKESRSESVTACVGTRDEAFSLTYLYINHPDYASDERLHKHEGTVILRMSEDGRLKGEYYSGRDRCTFGKLSLEKVKN